MAFIWIFIPAYLITLGSLGTDIISGMCIPWSLYDSRAAELAMISSFTVITYLFPLMAMTFCYSRIVYVLSKMVG